MNNLQKLFLMAVIFVISAGSLSAQLGDIKIGVYTDTYIRTDNDMSSARPYNYGTEPGFNLSNPLESSFGLNIAQISFMTATDDYRGNVTFHYGDIPYRAGWGMGTDDGSSFLQYLQQAWVGVQLVDNLWLDGGYFLSHIGTENLLPANNFFSNHSVMAVAEPFQQAGLRLSYIFSDNFTGSLHLLNGVGRFMENNYNKTAGLGLAYSTDEDDITVAYNGAFGNEQGGEPSNSKLTMLHNIVFYFAASEMIELKAGFDYFTTEDAVRNTDNNLETGAFMGLSGAARFLLHEQFKAGLRVAYFDNTDGVTAVTSGYLPAYAGIDLTLGGEYNPTTNSYIRLEGRMLMVNDLEDNEDSGKIFNSGDDATNTRMGVSLNFGLWFN